MISISNVTILISLSLVVTNAFAQEQFESNVFNIGIFGAHPSMSYWQDGCEFTYETRLHEGYKTSVLNVLSEDGFNIFQTQAPNEWTSENFLKSHLKLANANGFRVELNAGHYYNPSGGGFNVYDNCKQSINPCSSPYDIGYFRPNINSYLNNVFSQSPYKEIIWGYHICEEAAVTHNQHFAMDCIGNEWNNPAYFTRAEIPPSNVFEAIMHFKNSLSQHGILNHKMVVMEQNHHKSINLNSSDGNGIYNAQDYLNILSKNDARDVFFEGSYTKFPSDQWQTQTYTSMFNNGFHYLGSFKSIDYAKSFSSNVQKVINVEGTSIVSDYMKHYHSNVQVPNANWLWFQAYNSIIHGAKGIWFWDLGFSYNEDEINHWGDLSNESRFNRQFFPENYRNFIAHLGKELRFLVNQDILTTDLNSVVATKTDHADYNCILPAAISYIPSFLPFEFRSEYYGLRYTIRSNGSDTYMIITNPLNVSVSTTLSFANSSNPIIQNSTGVYWVFESGPANVAMANYKVDRNSNIDLVNGLVGSQYFSNFTQNKTLPISLGPLDVKIIKFAKSNTSLTSQWDKKWSNNGNNRIDGHIISDNDLFLTGDFDGDGSEELMCVGFNPVGNSDWISILKYENEKWDWFWSNDGHASAGNGLYNYRNNFMVGDFDGDGKDELLGNNINGWTTMYQFVNNDWVLKWSDYGSPVHPIRTYKDKFYIGDFNGDGKDEILGCDLPTGWTTEFKWNGFDFVWSWSDYGTWLDFGISHPLRAYRHNLKSGDFDGDGKTELLGLDAWATTFDFENDSWNWGWSNYGSNNFNGWNYPLLNSDVLLIGNLDIEPKEELFFLQTHSSSSWAATMDFSGNQSGWNWNWSANPFFNMMSIHDWPLNPSNGTMTKYILVKAVKNEPHHLLTMRKFCTNYLVNLYKPLATANFKNNSNRIEPVVTDKDNAASCRIFPNPSSGEFEVVIYELEMKNLSITDANGREIWSKNNIGDKRVSVNLNDQKAGVYYINITDSSNSGFFRKLILIK